MKLFLLRILLLLLLLLSLFFFFLVALRRFLQARFAKNNKQTEKTPNEKTTILTSAIML